MRCWDYLFGELGHMEHHLQAYLVQHEDQLLAHPQVNRELDQLDHHLQHELLDQLLADLLGYEDLVQLVDGCGLEFLWSLAQGLRTDIPVCWRLGS